LILKHPDGTLSINKLEATTATGKVGPYILSDSGWNAVKTNWPGTSEANLEIQSFIYQMLKPNWLFVMTTFDPGMSARCTTGGGSNTAVDLGPLTYPFYGVIYAPTGGCHLSFSELTTAFGAFACWAIKYSGSNSELHWDPGVLPPIDPHIGISN
jgi:hypothetical protein